MKEIKLFLSVVMFLSLSVFVSLSFLSCCRLVFLCCFSLLFVSLSDDLPLLLSNSLLSVFLSVLCILILCQDVAEKTFQKCLSKNLTHLSLSGMRLSELPSFFRQDNSLSASTLSHILDLNLSNNNLFNQRNLFQIISLFSNLQKLNLSSNSLNGILDDMIGSFHALEELQLQHNQITGLPPSVRHWKCLQLLNVSDNCLVRIPEEAKEWNSLVFLSARNNQINDIPNTVFHGWRKVN